MKKRKIADIKTKRIRNINPTPQTTFSALHHHSYIFFIVTPKQKLIWIGKEGGNRVYPAPPFLAL
ncbi:MAG TPA: hypothetical protein PLG79_07790 [Spirochaetales bacterium]|nr:hypothetical protein [Spirochaetales bacterium]